MCPTIWVRLWCHPPFSVILTPPTTHTLTLTLNVSCYRAQRSSGVYFPMMLSAMWLPTLRGEGNQPFYLQGRGSIQGLTPYFPQLSSKCLSFSRNPTPFLSFTAVPVPGWLVGPELPSIPVKSSFPQRYKSQYPQPEPSKNKQREKWLFSEVWRTNWLGYLALS